MFNDFLIFLLYLHYIQDLNHPLSGASLQMVPIWFTSSLQLFDCFGVQLVMQMKPSNNYNGEKISPLKPLEQLWHQSGSCREGTVPIRRTGKADLLRAGSLTYGMKADSYQKEVSYNFLCKQSNQTRPATKTQFWVSNFQLLPDKMTFKNTIYYSIGVTWVKEVQVWPSWWLKIMNVGFGLALLEIWLGFDRPISSHLSFIHTSIWTRSILICWVIVTWGSGAPHVQSRIWAATGWDGNRSGKVGDHWEPLLLGSNLVVYVSFFSFSFFLLKIWSVDEFIYFWPELDC